VVSECEIKSTKKDLGPASIPYHHKSKGIEKFVRVGPGGGAEMQASVRYEK